MRTALLEVLFYAGLGDLGEDLLVQLQQYLHSDIILAVASHQQRSVHRHLKLNIEEAPDHQRQPHRMPHNLLNPLLLTLPPHPHHKLPHRKIQTGPELPSRLILIHMPMKSLLPILHIPGLEPAGPLPSKRRITKKLELVELDVLFHDVGFVLAGLADLVQGLFVGDGEDGVLEAADALVADRTQAALAQVFGVEEGVGGGAQAAGFEAADGGDLERGQEGEVRHPNIIIGEVGRMLTAIRNRGNREEFKDIKGLVSQEFGSRLAGIFWPVSGTSGK